MNPLGLSTTCWEFTVSSGIEFVFSERHREGSFTESSTSAMEVEEVEEMSVWEKGLKESMNEEKLVFLYSQNKEAEISSWDFFYPLQAKKT